MVTTNVGSIPVEVHIAGSQEQAFEVLGRFLELLATKTSPDTEPLLRLACAADSYLNELNNTLVRHGSSRQERRLPRVALAIGTHLAEAGASANFSIDASRLTKNAVVAIVQHGHTVCMTATSGRNGETVVLSGNRATACVVAGQRLLLHPGDLTDLGTYFGVQGMVVAAPPASVPRNASVNSSVLA
jgi:hypothetical protein